MQDLTLLAEGRGVTNIDIHWQTDLPDPSASVRDYIEQRWAQYQADAKKRNGSLFNAPITCLVSAARQHDTITLDLAPTDYKTFVVTVLRDRPWFEQNAPHAMRRAMGNSVLLTHDNHALLGIRSPRVSAYAGRAHLIGGVLDCLATPELPASIEGILHHLRREMHEEAAIEPHEIAVPPRLLAVVRDEHLGQPELIWQCEMAIPLDRVAARLAAEEHDASLMLDNTQPDPALWTRMTPVARAAWQRWSTQ